VRRTGGWSAPRTRRKNERRMNGDECGGDIEKTEHRVLDGKRSGYEEPANRLRVRIEAIG
jgi:hypothetical protein